MRSLGPALRAFFSARVASRADAEDLIQELCVRVISARLPEKIDSNSAFLFHVASNLVKDYYRSRGSRQSNAHLPIYDLDVQDDSAPLDLALDARLRLERALRAIDALSEPARTVFRLHRMEGTTLEDTAELTGLTVPKVRKLLAGALALLARRVWSD